MIKLSKRLKIIFDMVPKSVVADIGSDHGKLMIALVEAGIVSKGYAVENKEGPFERLRSNLIRYRVNDNCLNANHFFWVGFQNIYYV